MFFVVNQKNEQIYSRFLFCFFVELFSKNLWKKFAHQHKWAMRKYDKTHKYPLAFISTLFKYLRVVWVSKRRALVCICVYVCVNSLAVKRRRYIIAVLRQAWRVHFETVVFFFFTTSKSILMRHFRPARLCHHVHWMLRRTAWRPTGLPFLTTDFRPSNRVRFGQFICEHHLRFRHVRLCRFRNGSFSKTCTICSKVDARRAVISFVSFCAFCFTNGRSNCDTVTSSND